MTAGEPGLKARILFKFEEIDKDLSEKKEKVKRSKSKKENQAEGKFKRNKKEKNRFTGSLK